MPVNTLVCVYNYSLLNDAKKILRFFFRMSMRFTFPKAHVINKEYPIFLPFFFFISAFVIIAKSNLSKSTFHKDANVFDKFILRDV